MRLDVAFFLAALILDLILIVAILAAPGALTAILGG